MWLTTSRPLLDLPRLHLPHGPPLSVGEQLRRRAQPEAFHPVSQLADSAQHSTSASASSSSPHHNLISEAISVAALPAAAAAAVLTGVVVWSRRFTTYVMCACFYALLLAMYTFAASKREVNCSMRQHTIH